MSDRHPVITEPPSEKLKGIWVRNKRTDAIGYITMVIKFRPYIDTLSQVYVVFPPLPHNKRVASIKTYTGGVYEVEDLVKIKKPRKEMSRWFSE